MSQQSHFLERFVFKEYLLIPLWSKCMSISHMNNSSYLQKKTPEKSWQHVVQQFHTHFSSWNLGNCHYFVRWNHVITCHSSRAWAIKAHLFQEHQQRSRCIWCSSSRRQLQWVFRWNRVHRQMGKCAWHALQNTSRAFLSWAVASAQQDASSDFQVIGAGELLCVATCQWKNPSWFSADPGNASMGTGQTSVMGVTLKTG